MSRRVRVSLRSSENGTCREHSPGKTGKANAGTLFESGGELCKRRGNVRFMLLIWLAVLSLRQRLLGDLRLKVISLRTFLEVG